jgi:hypothetical protein
VTDIPTATGAKVNRIAAAVVVGCALVFFLAASYGYDLQRAFSAAPLLRPDAARICGLGSGAGHGYPQSNLLSVRLAWPSGGANSGLARRSADAEHWFLLNV